MTNYKLDDKAKYAESHEWVRIEDGVAVVGISDAAQDQLSDVVYVDLPEEGRAVRAGEAIAVVESVKAASDVYSPVDGEVQSVNEALTAEPGLVNASAEGDGWLWTMSVADESQLEGLMDADAYQKSIA